MGTSLNKNLLGVYGHCRWGIGSVPTPSRREARSSCLVSLPRPGEKSSSVAISSRFGRKMMQTDIRSACYYEILVENGKINAAPHFELLKRLMDRWQGNQKHVISKPYRHALTLPQIEQISSVGFNPFILSKSAWLRGLSCLRKGNSLAGISHYRFKSGTRTVGIWLSGSCQSTVTSI